MSVIRIIKDKNFITMGKYHLKEKDMSLKAKGLLSQMLSLPDNWDYSINGLTKINKESYDTIRGILNELEQFGYLQRTQIKNESGKFVDVEYTIYEKPLTEKPITENPLTENYQQLNTKELNNKEIEKINNKKEIYKESWDCEEFVKNFTEAIVDYLNEKTGRQYKTNNLKTISLVRARLKDGFKQIDFIRVVDTKCDEWLDTEMEKYLRPDTLFGTKFDNYLNQREWK